MTKKKASAPNQVQLIEQLTRDIQVSEWDFLTDSEKVNGTVLLEGEWNYRVNEYLKHHVSGNKLHQDYVRGILARAYRAHLPKKVYEWQTKIFKDPAQPKRKKEEVVKSLQRLFKR